MSKNIKYNQVEGDASGLVLSQLEQELTAPKDLKNTDNNVFYQGTTIDIFLNSQINPENAQHIFVPSQHAKIITGEEGDQRTNILNNMALNKKDQYPYYLYIPVGISKIEGSNPNHWSGIIVEKHQDTNNDKIFIFEPKNQKENPNKGDEGTPYVQAAQNKAKLIYKNLFDTDIDDKQLITSDVKVQNDGVSCGPYVCEFLTKAYLQNTSETKLDDKNINDFLNTIFPKNDLGHKNGERDKLGDKLRNAQKESFSEIIESLKAQQLNDEEIKIDSVEKPKEIKEIKEDETKKDDKDKQDTKKIVKNNTDTATKKDIINPRELDLVAAEKRRGQIEINTMATYAVAAILTIVIAVISLFSGGGGITGALSTLFIGNIISAGGASGVGLLTYIGQEIGLLDYCDDHNKKPKKEIEKETNITDPIEKINKDGNKNLDSFKKEEEKGTGLGKN
jgi:hypothetical protein